MVRVHRNHIINGPTKFLIKSVFLKEIKKEEATVSLNENKVQKIPKLTEDKWICE